MTFSKKTLHSPIQNILLAPNPFHCFFAKSLWAGKKIKNDKNNKNVKINEENNIKEDNINEEDNIKENNSDDDNKDIKKYK